jgi:hypothetical protein
LDAIFKGIVAGPQTVDNKPVQRVHLLKTAWFKYAAAILLLIAAATTYFFIHTSKPETAVINAIPPPATGDIPPGFNRAVLTLSDGRKVELDSAASETISDGTLSIENNNGQLIYSGRPPTPFEKGGAAKRRGISFNTMTTPRGGQYQLTLSDGTRVWLNAASSITYPTAFTGKTREVQITGEAFFEVKANKEKPFIVTTSTDKITVLGTAFNVNAYADEPSIKTSLLEGSVNVNDRNIKPGQAYHGGKVIQTDVIQDVAWKNGAFIFNGSDLRAVMRQLARWYDIEVKYKGRVSDEKFSGKLTRDLPLSQVLEVLKSFNIRTRLVGKTLIVE